MIYLFTFSSGDIHKIGLIGFAAYFFDNWLSSFFGSDSFRSACFSGKVLAFAFRFQFRILSLYLVTNFSWVNFASFFRDFSNKLLYRKKGEFIELTLLSIKLLELPSFRCQNRLLARQPMDRLDLCKQVSSPVDIQY